MWQRRILGYIGLYMLVAAVVIFSVFPFYYAIVTSFKSGSDLFRVDYWPHTLNFINYVAAFTEQPFHINIFNSVIVAVAVVVLSLFLGVTAAYALGRVHLWPYHPAADHSRGCPCFRRWRYCPGCLS
ncbi:MAG: hypothetical protein R3E95_19725 [Thiolinea sp.]